MFGSTSLHRSDLASVLEQIARAGYAGVEIGAHKAEPGYTTDFTDLTSPFRPGCFRYPHPR